MGKLFVKDGTPVGNQHLCKNCTWGQFMTGFRESDVMVICTNSTPSFRIPFTVHECSEFQDKSRPDWEQMEKLAIEIEPVRRSKKVRGFGHCAVDEPDSNEFERDGEEFVDAVARGR